MARSHCQSDDVRGGPQVAFVPVASCVKVTCYRCTVPATAGRPGHAANACTTHDQTGVLAPTFSNRLGPCSATILGQGLLFGLVPQQPGMRYAVVPFAGLPRAFLLATPLIQLFESPFRAAQVLLLHFDANPLPSEAFRHLPSDDKKHRSVRRPCSRRMGLLWPGWHGDAPRRTGALVLLAATSSNPRE